MWELRNARVTFGDTTAVDDVTLTIGRGEIVVVLGPSGCGKSTLLRAIAGLERLAGGTVSIDGDDATDRPPHARGIGMVFQDATLFPHRDVGRNIDFGLRVAGLDPASRAERVAAALELVGLIGYQSRDVANLSGGEAHRVALARSLAPRPYLLLLDEPFAALDRALRDRMLDELPAILREAGASAVHVTHDQDEAFAIADRIAVMHEGRVLRVDTPQRLFADPRTETVARFLGHTNIVGTGADRRVLRRDAASVDPEGDLRATVVTTRFRGDHHEVTMDSDLGRLRFQLDTALGIGDEIRLVIDPSRVAPIRG